MPPALPRDAWMPRMAAPRPSLVSLAALAAALLLAPGNVAAQDAANPLRICTSEWTPSVFCNDIEPDAYSGAPRPRPLPPPPPQPPPPPPPPPPSRLTSSAPGFEVELCRKALQLMNIPPEAQRWSCEPDWDEMLAELAADDSKCDVVCAGQNVDSAGLEAGMTYSCEYCQLLP